MRKLTLLLLCILVFNIIVFYINAKEDKPKATQFEEFLQGLVEGPMPWDIYGPWNATKGELIKGMGNLMGSQIQFTLVSNRRFKMDDQKSFIDGSWIFVLSDGSQISGIFNGKGMTPTEFSGMFETTKSQKSPGIKHSDAIIKGMFSCEFLPPEAYGGFWRYEAWWNGTIKKGES